MPCPHDPLARSRPRKKFAQRRLLLFVPLASGRHLCPPTTTQRARLRSPLNPPLHFRTAGGPPALLNLVSAAIERARTVSSPAAQPQASPATLSQSAPKTPTPAPPSKSPARSETSPESSKKTSPAESARPETNPQPQHFRLPQSAAR